MSVKRHGELALSAEACTQNKPTVNPGIRRGYITKYYLSSASSLDVTNACLHAQQLRPALPAMQTSLWEPASSRSGNRTSNNVAAVVVAAVGLQVPAKAA